MAAPAEAPRASAPAPAAVRGFPHFDLEPGCRRAERQKCLDDEHTARDQLAKEWQAFAASDRTLCTQTVTDGAGPPSYVELLTCLELARDAKKLPKE